MSSERENARIMITEAICSHIKWKDRIESAIRSNDSVISVEKIGNSNNCLLGQWLSGNTLPKSMKESSYYYTVCSTHSKFHAATLEIISAIEDSGLDKFEEIFTVIEKYNALSDELVMDLDKWWWDVYEQPLGRS